MGCLGVHFALSSADHLALLSAATDAERLELITDDIEDRYFAEPATYMVQTDKAWDAIHRALTDGDLAYDNGAFPLSHVILGGKPLYVQDDYIISLKTAAQVQAIAAALPSVTQETLRSAYFALDPAKYGDTPSEDDFAYVWDWFTGLAPFYQAAATDGRPVIFTADQ